MGTTPNNSFPYPEATGLVKDGWEDIKDLATSIDTKLGVYNPAGLTLINTTTFSAVSSQSINDIFSSTYENYRIVFNVISSVGEVDARLRLRVSGTDASGSNYEYAVASYGSSSSNYNIASLGNQTYWVMGRFGGNSQGIMSVDISRPNLAERTQFVAVNGANGTTTYFTERGSGVHAVSTAYTGMTVFGSSGTLTGTVRIFGYRNS